MKTLDRSRPYGVICPKHEGAAYEQDGRMFDINGKAMGGATLAAPVSETVKRGPGRPRKEQVEALPLATNPQVAAQLSAQLAEDA